MKIGFVGLGRMGKGIVKNLIEGGNELYVYDIRKEAVDFAVARGAKAVASSKAAAQAGSCCCTSLPGPLEVEEVVLGENGILAGAKKGDIYIDFSTNSPALIRKIATMAKEKGVDVIDAPISGGASDVNWNKGCNTLVGGDKEVVERARKVILDMCKAISYCGPVGNGMIVKIINNTSAFTIYCIFYEAMSLAIKSGVEPAAMWERFETNLLGPTFQKLLPPRMLAGNFEALFALDLMYKDVKLTVDEAKVVNVPYCFGAMALEKAVEARTKGLGQLDATAVGLLWEELNGVKIRI